VPSIVTDVPIKLKAQLHNLRAIRDVSLGSDPSGFVEKFNNESRRMVRRRSEDSNHGSNVPAMKTSLGLID